MAFSDFQFRSASSTERWTLAHALVILVAAAAATWAHTVIPFLAAGFATFIILIIAERKHWTPRGEFGAANWITALRVVLLGLLPLSISLGPAVLIGLSLLILVLDQLDGWLARRHSLTSEFGAFFDKETDALFLLLLSGLATFRGPLPMWILGAGLLRYGFVVVLFLVPSPETTESRSKLARYVYGLMVGALLTSFLPYPTLYRPLVIGATAALLFSFGRSFWRIVPRQEALGES